MKTVLNKKNRMSKNISIGTDCCVDGCTNFVSEEGSSNVQFFHFPETKKARKVWCDAIQMDPESITTQHVICDAHFPDDMFTISINKQLNDGAVPKCEEDDFDIDKDMGEAESIFGVEYLEEVSYDVAEHYKIDSIEPAVGFPCEMCNSVFATRDERNDHIDDHFKVHECTSCQKSFLGIKKFEHHRRTIGSCKRTDPSSDCITFECFVCHKGSFFSTRSLRLHFNRYHRLAAEEKPKKSSTDQNNICKVCNLTFSNVYIMRTHMTEIHALAGSYVCDICSKKFNRASNLKWHRLIHDDLMPCKCPVSGCGKFFRTISGLNLHKRTHTGEKPYKCDQLLLDSTPCDKSYAYNTDLKRHKRSVHGIIDKVFPCSMCENKVFYEPKFLRNHMQKAHND